MRGRIFITDNASGLGKAIGMFYAKSGDVVNIASMAGITNAQQMGIYNCSKAGVIALTETLYYESAPYNVSAHAACPAFFKTNLTDSMISSDKSIGFVNKLMESSPLTADDIAKSVCEIEQARLLTLNAAQKIDDEGNKVAKYLIAMIKIMAPNMALNVIDRAIKAMER